MSKFNCTILGILSGMLIGSFIRLEYTLILVSSLALILCIIEFIKFLVFKKDINKINNKLNDNK